MLQNTRAKRGSGARLIALTLVLLMLVAAVQLSSFPLKTGAAGSATFSGETITVYLQDSSWNDGAQIRVTQLDSGGSAVKTETLTPADSKVTVTAQSGAVKLTLEKLNSTKNANLTAMKDVISGASSTQMVVFYDNSSAQWTGLKYYAWSKVSGVTYKDADWDNRKSLTRLGTTNIWYAVINKNASLSGPYDNIIFTGSGKQTEDLALKRSTDSDVEVYSTSTNKWIAYTAVDASATASASDRVDNEHNNLYIVSRTKAKWSKYNASSPTATVYYKPNSAWTTAYVHYDDDDGEPFYASVLMEKYPTSNTLIFYATVYQGAMVSFSDGSVFDTSAHKDQGSVFADTAEPVYVARDRSWTTLNNALTSDTLASDIQIANYNFNSVTPTGGGKVVGFDAYYYDYLSDNERIFGWRNQLNDDASFPDEYRLQFSSLNNEIIALAKQSANTDWRYPMVFGDDTDANLYIDPYYSQLSSGSAARTPAITQDKFRAVNNSGYLGTGSGKDESHRDYSIMGLVQDELKYGSLYVTDSLMAPYFDNYWLMQNSAVANKEVLYVLDNANFGQDGIYANFFTKGTSTHWTDIHPYKIADSVTIGGKTGTLYAYILEPNSYKSCQLSHTTEYGDDKVFWSYKENGTWVVSSFEDIVCTGGGSVGKTSAYHSGIQSLGSGRRAEIISAKFPFVETVDSTTKVKTYTFNSNGSSRKDNISFAISDRKLYYYNSEGYKGKLDGNNGFFPMNGAGHETRNYGFGVRVDMDFTIPENGKFPNGTPAKFNYSGDDDVWVFIDGNLILDIGGAHRPTTGSINFAAGTNLISATTNKVARILNNTTGEIDVTKNSAVTKTFNFNNTDPTKKHRMTVFYLERGTNDSNLKIEFSIQPILNELNVYKEVEVENVNHGIVDTVEELAQNSDFDFTFLHKGSGYGGTSGKPINTVHADDTTSTATIKNGAFKLRHYEEAMFHNDTDLTYGDTMKVSEAVQSHFASGTASPYVYDTDIVIKDNLNGSTIAPTQKNDKDVTFAFQNGENKSEERTSLVAEFTNTLKVGSLKLKKELYQQNSTTPSDMQPPFEFTLGLDLDNDGTYESYDLDYYFDGAPDDVYTADGGVVQMRPDQTIIFPGIPVGAPYRLTETVKAGYRNKGAATVTGTIPDGGKTVTFKNEESPSSQNIDITKKLDNALYTGDEFTFRCELIRWTKSDSTVVTDAATLNPKYAANEVSHVRDGDELGVVGFDPFNIVPDDANAGTYVFKITEIDKSGSQPYYVYDAQPYFVKIAVTPGSVAAPLYFKDADCTESVSSITFMNTTKKGSITVNKVDADDQPLNGTQFALIKVASKDSVDEHLTPEAINTLKNAYKDDAAKVTLRTTATNGTKSSAIFDDLYVYQKDGQFVYDTTENKLVWSTAVTATAAQTYCIFEYSPTEGYLPNYSKSYVTLAEKTNFEETFGYVDGMIVMPNSAGPGSDIFRTVGLCVIGIGSLLAGAYIISRRRRPAYQCRHLYR